MKTMKLFICAITLFLFTSSAIAQERTLTDVQKEKFEEHLKASFEKLDLSEEQQPKFKEITKQYALQMKTLKTSDQSKTAKVEEFKSLIESKNNEMKALLSANQYKVYEQTQKENQQKFENIKASFEKLDLSQDQQPKFIEITKKYTLKIKDLKASGNKSRLVKFKEFQSIMYSKNREMRALLSAEQYKVYEEIQKEKTKEFKSKI